MATDGGTVKDGFIEIFHSKPSWKNCYLIYKTSPNAWSPPAQNPLVWAGHIREGFRVYRTRAHPFVFALTNGTARQWEDNSGKYYTVDAPGRYVVEHGIRRVDDADDVECAHALDRKTDKHVQLQFHAQHDWGTKCFFVAACDGGNWNEAPGTPMQVVQRSAEGIVFEALVQAKRMAFAFTDGVDRWDSNLNKNYQIGLPGKYCVANGEVRFLGPAEKDLREEEASPVQISGEITVSGTEVANAVAQANGSFVENEKTRMPVGAK